jgi:hypothetical protein
MAVPKIEIDALGFDLMIEKRLLKKSIVYPFKSIV